MPCKWTRLSCRKFRHNAEPAPPSGSRLRPYNLEQLDHPLFVLQPVRRSGALRKSRSPLATSSQLPTNGATCSQDRSCRSLSRQAASASYGPRMMLPLVHLPALDLRRSSKPKASGTRSACRLTECSLDSRRPSRAQAPRSADRPRTCARYYASCRAIGLAHLDEVLRRVVGQGRVASR